MKKKSEFRERFDGAVQQVVVAVLIALLFGAFKLYTDVQTLKTKFEYVNGRWDAPAERK